LAARLREEIRGRGAIPFARFMELALYAPGLGYYEQERPQVGRAGDFLTSVSVGPIFGWLLAMQFALWETSAHDGLTGPPPALQLVEAGAHDGRLAVDILDWLEARRPSLYSRLRYWVVDPSPRRRAWQRKVLTRHERIVQWAATVPEVPSDGFRIVFSNELLDAMPVHRLGWDAANSAWFEWGVSWGDEGFRWVKLSPPTLNLEHVPGMPPGALLPVLPDGFIVETSPAAQQWWSATAASLGRGILVTIDYGYTEEQRFSPNRTRGTLRAFQRHRAMSNLLSEPGEQDITAHVDWTTIRETGEAAGLTTIGLFKQGQFFASLGAKWQEEMSNSDELIESELTHLKELIHDDHFGRHFSILVQATHDARVTIEPIEKS